MTLIKPVLLISVLLLSSFLNATTFKITDTYIRATPPHTQNSVAFMKISNNSDSALKLISASSDIAERVEIHTHTMSDGMMKMRQVDAVDIDANAQIELRPGGFHIMFLGIKFALIEGETAKIKLYFSNGEKIIVDAPIKKIIMQNR